MQFHLLQCVTVQKFRLTEYILLLKWSQGKNNVSLSLRCAACWAHCYFQTVITSLCLFVHHSLGLMFLFLVCLSRKEQIAEQREYKKKKAQKKVQRMKELEQEREEQKSKWQQFNNKAYSKNKKGQVFINYFLVFYLKYRELWYTIGVSWLVPQLCSCCRSSLWDYVYIFLTSKFSSEWGLCEDTGDSEDSQQQPLWYLIALCPIRRPLPVWYVALFVWKPAF